MKKTIKFTSKKNAPITAHSKRFTGPTMDSTSELKPSNTLATESRIHELKQSLAALTIVESAQNINRKQFSQ
jgi:hypothetical protein